MTQAHDPDPMEIELKLAFPAEARARIDAHPVFRQAGAAGGKTSRQVSTYYDTPDRSLAAHGLSLRVRTANGRRTQTLKSADNGNAAAASRGEWEWAVRSDRPDTKLLAGTPAAAFIDAALRPVAVTDIRRTVRTLALAGETLVEAALDEGVIHAGNRECPVHELELELKRGSLVALYQLALTLHADLPLRIEPEAKAVRGYRLGTGLAPAARKMPLPALDARVTTADGVRRLLSAALAELIANQPAAAAGDPAGVHNMRIAVRRLRSALVLFKPHLQPYAATRFENELRRLGRLLGDARDWDVFTLETLPAALDDGHRRILGSAAEAKRQTMLHRLREEFAKPELTGLILSLAAWAEDATLMLDRSAHATRLSELAPALLGRLARKVAKRGRRIGRLSGPALHDVRKSLKKLRYAADDLAGLYSSKRVLSFRKHCKGMQDELGLINDAAMAITLGESLGADGHIDRVPAVAAVTRWGEKRRHKALRKLPEDWKQFRHAPAFWQ